MIIWKRERAHIVFNSHLRGKEKERERKHLRDKAILHGEKSAAPRRPSASVRVFEGFEDQLNRGLVAMVVAIRGAYSAPPVARRPFFVEKFRKFFSGGCFAFGRTHLKQQSS
jgi:hypothetical protein